MIIIEAKEWTIMKIIISTERRKNKERKRERERERERERVYLRVGDWMIEKYTFCVSFQFLKRNLISFWNWIL